MKIKKQALDTIVATVGCSSEAERASCREKVTGLIFAPNQNMKLEGPRDSLEIKKLQLTATPEKLVSLIILSSSKQCYKVWLSKFGWCNLSRSFYLWQSPNFQKQSFLSLPPLLSLGAGRVNDSLLAALLLCCYWATWVPIMFRKWLQEGRLPRITAVHGRKEENAASRPARCGLFTGTEAAR